MKWDAYERDLFTLMEYQRERVRMPGKPFICGMLFEYRGFRFVLHLDPHTPVPLGDLRRIPTWNRLSLLSPLKRNRGAGRSRSR